MSIKNMKHRSIIILMMLGLAIEMLILDLMSINFRFNELMIMAHFCLVILITIITIKMTKTSLANLISLKNARFKATILCFLLGMCITLFGDSIRKIIEESIFKLPEATTLEVSTTSKVIIIISSIIIAPLFEEIQFRGLLFTSLSDNNSKPKLGAVLLSSLMFMMLHTGSIHVGAIILGVFSCFVYFKGKSLIYSIALHLGCNSFMLLFAVLGLIFSTDEPVHPEEIEVIPYSLSAVIKESLFCGVLMLIISFLLFSKLKKQNKSLESKEIQANYQNKDDSLPIMNKVETLGIIVYLLICFTSSCLLYKNKM